MRRAADLSLAALVELGTAILVHRHLEGSSARPLMNVGFIACSGQENAKAQGPVPTEAAIARTRSLWLTADRAVDASATAVYEHLWFSARAVD
jgi:protein-L-isoaspartate(D-aspartate) O-methyltransferase